MEAIVEMGPCICGVVVFNGSLCSGVEGIELEKLIDICVMQVQQIHILHPFYIVAISNSLYISATLLLNNIEYKLLQYEYIYMLISYMLDYCQYLEYLSIGIFLKYSFNCDRERGPLLSKRLSFNCSRQSRVYCRTCGRCRVYKQCVLSELIQHEKF